MKIFFTTVIFNLLLNCLACNGQVSNFQTSTYDNPQWMSKINSQRRVRQVEVSGTPYEMGFQYGAACPEIGNCGVQRALFHKSGINILGIE